MSIALLDARTLHCEHQETAMAHTRKKIQSEMDWSNENSITVRDNRTF